MGSLAVGDAERNREKERKRKRGKSGRYGGCKINISELITRGTLPDNRSYTYHIIHNTSYDDDKIPVGLATGDAGREEGWEG